MYDEYDEYNVQYVITFHCHTVTLEHPEVVTIEHVSVLLNTCMCIIHVQYMYVLSECTTDYQCTWMCICDVDGLTIYLRLPHLTV